MPDFQLTAKQEEFFDLAKGPATYILAAGGSRSGKTAVTAFTLITRALRIDNSRTGVFRQTAVSCRSTLFDLTFKDVMRLAYPNLIEQCKINETEMSIEFPNGSIILFFGLDDKNRLDRILGQEFLTIYCNEVSEIADFSAVTQLMTRLSQQCTAANGKPARPKMFFDCNPPSKKHWTYQAWVEGIHPLTRLPHKNADQWAWIKMNPIDNTQNLTANYFDTLANLSARQQKRFLEGEWQTEVEGALFNVDWFRRVNPIKFNPDDLKRIIVAVDPAASSKAGSDETGIVVAGIDHDDEVYILDDASLRGTPDQWARRAAAMFEQWKADLIVAEKNNGGDMVEHTLRSAGLNLPVKLVHATRGKALRAEPVSTLYEKGRVHHVGEFAELEDQMENFTHDFNRTKQGSPDRLDALVWAVWELTQEKQHAPSPMTVTKAAGFY